MTKLDRKVSSKLSVRFLKRLNRFAVAAIFGLIFSAVAFAIVFSSSQTARAEEATSITISPARQPIDIAPGVDYKGSIKVINSGTQEFDFSVSVDPYGIANEDYDPRFDVKDDLNKIVDWVSFEEYDKTLAPGETREVKYELRVPETAVPGGQYAVMFAETIPSTSSAGTGVTVGKRVGSLLFAKIAGDAIYSGEVVEQKIDSWYQKLPAPTVLRIHNTGTVDSEAAYGLVVKNLWGKEIFDITKTGDSGKKLIIPHTTRRIPLNWQQEGTWFGIYQIKQSVQFADQNSFVNKWVLYCPLWVIIAIIVFILLVIFLIILKVHSAKKKKKAKLTNANLNPLNGLTPEQQAQFDGGFNAPQTPQSPAQNDPGYEDYLRFKQWQDSQNDPNNPQNPQNPQI